MALAGAAAGAVLVVFSSILGVEACNGHASFCMLPFNQFTFPGTHNSGSFSLNIPEIIEDNIPLVDVNAILSCYYDCHHMNYLEQLNFGIRFFFPDVCIRDGIGEPTTLYDCHSSSGTNAKGLAWNNKFAYSLQVMKDWLSVHTRQLLVVTPDDMHANVASKEEMWANAFAEKFGTCFDIHHTTVVSELPQQSETSCVRMLGRPGDNITMGDLIDRNLRMVVFTVGWRDVIATTWTPEANTGAKSKDLLEHIDKYSRGLQPLAPKSWMAFSVYGAASPPDFSMVDMSKPYDPIWPVMVGVDAMKKTDLRCVEKMAESYNTDLFQDDSNPYEYFTEKECENSICGCLGYKSPLEPIHQRLLDQGHSVLLVMGDYSEMGEKTSLPQLTQRMNFANLRRFLDQPEPVKTWWDCNWPAVVGVCVPLMLVCCCCCYAMMICLYPERYGLWIRKAWERHQEALAQKRMGREQGRKEARAYLRNANGYGAGAVPEGTVVGVVGVAPPPAAQMNHNGWYQAKETE